MPGLFGEMDAADVSDNPFYVAPDVYKCTLADLALVRAKNDDKKVGLSFKWSIDDEDSAYNNMTIQEWVNVYFNDEDARDEAALRRDRARLKSRLAACGMSESEMNQLVTADEMLNSEIADQYIGLEAYITVKETPDKNDDTKVYTNVTKVELIH